jgi:hypothetical protein
MEKPWFKLNPNNDKDRWWLYTSITDTKAALKQKDSSKILCHFIIKYNDNKDVKYRILTWFKNDPNRYLFIVRNNISLGFSKNLEDMVEGEIVKTDEGIKFEVYDCRFNEQNQNFVCKILERIDDIFYLYF